MSDREKDLDKVIYLSRGQLVTRERQLQRARIAHMPRQEVGAASYITKFVNNNGEQ